MYMNQRKSSRLIYGSLCSISAVVLYFSAVRFWLIRNEPYAGTASLVMAVIGLITAVSFTYIALAMFLPSRFKGIWKWWNQNG